MWLTTHLELILISITLSQLANARFTVTCTSPLVQVRLDPIMSPGLQPSNHVHTVHGANRYTLNSTYDTLRSATCTSCLVAEDQSNYWFPKLYFRDPNTGIFEPVPNGGLLVQYLHQGNGDVSNGGPGLKAFPPGFQVISGSPKRRGRKFQPGEGSQGELAERGLQWECLRSATATYNSSSELKGFPTTNCEGGFKTSIHMPSCWDGVNLDSPDHMSHTAYLSDLDSGSCPSTHPVPMMKLLYEVSWDVHALASRWDSSKNLWPFVWSTGDSTGYSWHGDFQNGWDTDALQNAIEKCDNPKDPTGSCSSLTLGNATLANECKQVPVVKEKIEEPMAKLPGCNPIQDGPHDSTFYSDLSCPIPTTSSGAYTNREGMERQIVFLAPFILAAFWFNS